MALSKIDVANMLTGATPVANGGTALTSGFVNGGGITGADQYRLTTSFTGDADPLSSNLERNDIQFDKIGNGMTVSSGIFTFPSTGIWLVQFQVMVNLANGDVECNYGIHGTTNNSSYSLLAKNTTGESSGAYQGTFCQTIMDITNTTTHKCKFEVNVGNNGSETHGNTSENRTAMTFIRLGDT